MPAQSQTLSLRLLVIATCLLLAGQGNSEENAELVVQRGAQVEVMAAAYSVDGRIIAAAGESESIRLWDRESGDLVRTLPGHPERVADVKFSPDGKWLASSCTDGSVNVWDYRAGRLLRTFPEHVGNWVRRLAFSPDSRWLVPASYDGKVSVWDLANGTVVRTLPTMRRVADVTFTPDGSFIVTASREEKAPLIQFWEAATGNPGLTLDHGALLNAVAISRNGRLLASGGALGVVHLWELPSGRRLRSVQTGDKAGVINLAFSPDGQRLAVTGKWVNSVFSTETGALVSELSGHDDGTVQISFSPDGKEVATASADATVRLWEAESGKLRRILPARPPDSPITSLAFSRNGAFEAMGSVDGVVRVWDAKEGGFKYDLRGHEGTVLALDFSAQGDWLFSGGADRVMRVWDMGRGALSSAHPYFDRIDAMGAIACGGPKGEIASASGPWGSASLDHTIKIWQSHFDRPIRVLQGHTANVQTIAFAPGVDRLASASVDGVLKLWDQRRNECLRTVTDAVLVERLVYLPDASALVAGMADGTLRVLDPETLATTREWRAHPRPVQSLVTSADGRWLATASADQTVAVWDFATGREVRRFDHVTSQYRPLAFHPERPVLAFARRDEMVVHAEVETGEILFQRVHFPDGEWLAWNPAKTFYMASPCGDEHARLRFPGQLLPVYPLTLYRGELRRESNLLGSLGGPAPVLKPKNYRLWWHRYPYKEAWLYSISGLAAVWIASRLRRGWVAERRRRVQEEISRQFLASQEAERKRIAAELHDGLGQNLLIIKNRLYLAQQHVLAAESTAALEEISQTVSQTIAEVREISYNLRPYQLDRLGLTKAVLAVVKKIAASGSLRIEHDVINIDGLFPPEGEINFYRIVQESMNNILKHSAAATAQLVIRRVAGLLTMHIEDDGRGFDYRQRASDAAAGARGFGLTGLRERVRILGGRFDCESSPGHGTRLTFEIPIPAQHESQH